MSFAVAIAFGFDLDQLLYVSWLLSLPYPMFWIIELSWMNMCWKMSCSRNDFWSLRCLLIFFSFENLFEVNFFLKLFIFRINWADLDLSSYRFSCSFTVEGVIFASVSLMLFLGKKFFLFFLAFFMIALRSICYSTALSFFSLGCTFCFLEITLGVLSWDLAFLRFC